MFWPPKYRYIGSTTPTDWDDYLSQTATRYYYYVTPVLNWKEVFIPLKWWRQHGVFRTWAAPRLLRPLEGRRQAMHKAQERYPTQQRMRRKRRAYVQRLHAL